MEIACGILKSTKNNYLQDNNTFTMSTGKSTSKYIFNNFKNLKLCNLATKNNLDSFLKIIQRTYFIETTTTLMQYFFENIDNNISTAILMAYCISSYSDVLFDTYKSRFEQKLIISANQVVAIIEKVLISKESFNHRQTLVSTVDHYYSLYKLWKSGESLGEMSKLFDNMTDIAILLSKKNNTNINKNLKILLTRLFELNNNYALRIMLHNYDIFKNLTWFEEFFWQDIVYVIYNQISEDQNNDMINSMFVISVVELKIKLIQLLNNPADRKEIYYYLDSEDMIDKIRKSFFNFKNMVEVIQLLQNKIQKIDITFPIENEITKDNILKIIRNMFNVLLNI